MAKKVKRSIKISVSGEIGKVSAQYIMPSDAKCIISLAHGAGAGMNHPFMTTLADYLAGVSIATLRFNFPFAECDRKRPDSPLIAGQTVEAALMTAHKLSATLPVFAGGKSFGARMTSRFLSDSPDSPVKGIVFYGFPLHAAGKPSVERADHLKKIKLPMLFLQGTRDALARFELIESVCSKLRSATLVEIEGADHSFKAGKIDTFQLLSKATNDWVDQILD